MTTPPSIDNYTVPGGIKLFFDDGSGEVDFGNIFDVEFAPKTTELDHYTNRSGKRMKDKVVAIEEALSLNFKVDEPVIETFQKFFKGGPISLVNAGTANKTDQQVKLSGEILTSLGDYYGISAVVVTSLDGLTTYTQNTDYIVDPGQASGGVLQPGRIGRLAGGAIADGATVLVDFTYVTWDSQKFSIAASSFKQGAARLEVHPASDRGLKFDVFFPLCQLKPNGNMSLDDKNWLAVPMTIEVLDNSAATPDTPFGYISYPAS